MKAAIDLLACRHDILPLLRQAGILVGFEPAQVKARVAETGFSFMFARTCRQAMHHVVPVWCTIGIRTMYKYNILGPLSDPAGTKYQFLGIFHKKWLQLVFKAAKAPDTVRLSAIHSHNSPDEFGITHPNRITELYDDGNIREYRIIPASFGINRQDHSDLQANSTHASLVCGTLTRVEDLGTALTGLFAKP